MLPLLDMLISGLAKHFGSTSEFVVHDFKGGTDFEHTIASIVNGCVTGRQLGDSILQVEMNPLSGASRLGDSPEGLFNYFARTLDGRMIKSSMIYIRNDAGTIDGAVCINSDVTQLQQAKTYIDHYVGFQPIAHQPPVPGGSSVDDMLVALIYESIDAIGVPVSAMNREQKMAGIKYLKERGAFKITKANEIIARYYDISKYTVYNYLNEVTGSASRPERQDCPDAPDAPGASGDCIC